MIFEPCKIDQIAFERKGWHLIADGFFCTRRGRMNCRPDLLQYHLNVIGKSGNIVINVFRSRLLHTFLLGVCISQWTDLDLKSDFPFWELFWSPSSPIYQSVLGNRPLSFSLFLGCAA